MTAGHIFRGVKNAEVNINGKWYPARLLAKRDNQNEDIAVIGVAYKGTIPCYPVHGSGSPIKSTFTVQAFAKRKLISSNAEITGNNSSGGIWASWTAQEGQSGGPALSDARSVFGIVKGYSDGNRSYLTGLPSIRSLLLERFGKIPRCGCDAVDSPKEQPKQEHDHDDLIAKIQSLELQLQRIREDYDNLKLKAGPQGPKGDKGERGEKGVPGGVITGIKIINSLKENNVVAKGVLVNGEWIIRMPDDVLQTTKSDGKTVTDSRTFPFGTPLRIKAEIPIEALKKALEGK